MIYFPYTFLRRYLLDDSFLNFAIVRYISVFIIDLLQHGTNVQYQYIKETALAIIVNDPVNKQTRYMITMRCSLVNDWHIGAGFLTGILNKYLPASESYFLEMNRSDAKIGSLEYLFKVYWVSYDIMNVILKVRMQAISNII